MSAPSCAGPAPEGGSDVPEKKDPKDPSTTSFAWDEMAPRWTKIESLLGGTEAMRDAGDLFLPQHEEESDPAYSERLSANVLFNMTELVLDSWVGRPFSDPVQLSEDMPEEIQAVTRDVNLQGDSIDVFARNWFRSGLSKAFSHVLVDMPRLEDLGRPRTRADDVRERVRPYWVMVRPENLIAAHATVVNSREVLTHIRIHEVLIDRQGFAEVPVEQIRQIDAQPDGSEPAMVTIWRKRETGRLRKKMQWIQEDQFFLGINFIPLETFYSDRQGLMRGKPVLTDLADLNIRHWQSMSDQIAILTVTRFPILAVSGAVEDDKIQIGPYKWLHVPDPNGKWYYVEHQGQAIEAGRKDILDLEERMAHYGAQFLRKQKSHTTATARALDSAEATSPLQDVTNRFVASLNRAIQMTARWLNIEQPGSATVSTDFGPEDIISSDLEALLEARRLRDISRQRFLAELKRRGTLADNFNSEENDRELRGEPETPPEEVTP